MLKVQLFDLLLMRGVLLLMRGVQLFDLLLMRGLKDVLVGIGVGIGARLWVKCVI